MTIKEAINYGISELASVPDPKIDSELLLCDVVGMNRLLLAINATQTLTKEQEEGFRAALRIRASRMPLQYILGTQCFYGCDLQVDERVLIPRQETEILCEQALISMERHSYPCVADICTGSGAIAITLKKFRPDAEVWATDLSPAAIKMAQENADNNCTEIAFRQGDLLSPLAGKKFDFIVSNPPYIKTADLDTLQPEVRREPRLALDGGKDGLDFYRRLANEAPEYLKENGMILVEFGDGQAKDVAVLFAAARRFEDIKIHRDLYGRRRIMEAKHRFT